MRRERALLCSSSTQGSSLSSSIRSARGLIDCVRANRPDTPRCSACVVQLGDNEMRERCRRHAMLVDDLPEKLLVLLRRVSAHENRTRMVLEQKPRNRQVILRVREVVLLDVAQSRSVDLEADPGDSVARLVAWRSAAFERLFY